jgi:hypothetical protein
MNNVVPASVPRRVGRAFITLIESIGVDNPKSPFNEEK